MAHKSGALFERAEEVVPAVGERRPLLHEPLHARGSDPDICETSRADPPVGRTRAFSVFGRSLRPMSSDVGKAGQKKTNARGN